MAERQAAMRAALFEGITLSADQKTKIDSIYTASQKATADLRASMTQGTPPSDELRAKMTAVQTEQFADLAGLLLRVQAGLGRQVERSTRHALHRVPVNRVLAGRAARDKRGLRGFFQLV